MLCAALAGAVLGLGGHTPEDTGSGRKWHSLYEHGRDGTGPPNVTFQLSWATGRQGGYQVSVYEDDQPQRPMLLAVVRKPDSIRFLRLERHHNPCNDIWEDRGQTIKQFPRLLFVAHGIEHGKPVSLVWWLMDEYWRHPRLLLKVFDGDARRLDMPEHGSRAKGGFLWEKADAAWLPKSDWPEGATSKSRVKRLWTYDSIRGFRQSGWRLR